MLSDVCAASKAKNVRILPKTADNVIEPETKSKEAKMCGSPQYEIMKVGTFVVIIYYNNFI